MSFVRKPFNPLHPDQATSHKRHDDTFRKYAYYHREVTELEGESRNHGGIYRIDPTMLQSAIGEVL